MRQDKLVQWLADPIGMFHRRQSLRLWWNKRPVIRPLGPLLDPFSKQGDLFRGEWGPMKRHTRFRVFRGDASDYFRGIRIARYDGPAPRFPNTERLVAKYERDSA